MVDAPEQDLLYVWLDTNPETSDAEATIVDVPGVSDLDLVAEALLSGHLGRYLPATIQFATHAQPLPDKVRSVDTARLLRDRAIPHRRRYEIILPESE